MLETLARYALFADLSADALSELAAAMTEERYGEGDWVLRVGQENTGLHVILEGEVGVIIDDRERELLHAGMFFGEISALLGDPVGADLVARSPLWCAVIEADRLVPLLLANPSLTLRLLQAEARRLSEVNRWLV